MANFVATSSMLLCIVVVVNGDTVASSSTFPPEQLRLAFGYEEDSMRVGWATYENQSAALENCSEVQWGTDPDRLDKTTRGNATLYASETSRNWTMHESEMFNLTSGEVKYFYRVGCDAHGWSDVTSFRSRKTTYPQTHVLFGDMGAAFAYSLCMGCDSDEVCECSANRSVGLVSEDPVMFLHTGDFAYNMDSNDGTTADNFFRNVESLTSRVPYMISHGNHEDSDKALARFTESFRYMPTRTGAVETINGPAPNVWFFSWNVGLVHYISLSTEIQGGAMLTRGGNDLIKRQFEFLESDLKAANANRDNVPWIVVNGHRSMYCSCDGDCDAESEQQRDGPWSNGTYGFEKLFFDNGVDFFINGHEHNYERLWPTYRNKTTQSNVEPNAPIFVVTGAAGCDELHEPFTRPQPPMSAFRSNTFGYSRMIVHNHTHVRWQQVMTDPTFFGPDDYGKIIDDTWVVQHNHGPFDPKHAPTSYEGSGKVGVSIDHWDGHEHPDTGIRLPNGARWKSDENVAHNARFAKFMKNFGDTCWESQHDDYHTNMALLMRQLAQTRDRNEREAIMSEMEALAESQA